MFHEVQGFAERLLQFFASTGTLRIWEQGPFTERARVRERRFTRQSEPCASVHIHTGLRFLGGTWAPVWQKPKPEPLAPSQTVSRRLGRTWGFSARADPVSFIRAMPALAQAEAGEGFLALQRRGRRRRCFHTQSTVAFACPTSHRTRPVIGRVWFLFGTNFRTFWPIFTHKIARLPRATSPIFLGIFLSL